jgi:hypothetical protein
VGIGLVLVVGGAVVGGVVVGVAESRPACSAEPQALSEARVRTPAKAAARALVIPL